MPGASVSPDERTAATPADDRGRCCEEIARLADEFLERELDDATATAVSAHLGGCAACARLYAELALTIAAVRRIGPRLLAAEAWITSARRR